MPRPTRIDQIRHQFEQPGLAQHLWKLRADQSRRISRQSRPDTIITVPHFTGSRKDYLLSPVKGSIMLFWAPRGSKVIADLADAYAAGDDDTLRRLSAQAAREMKRHPVASLDEGFQILLDSPMYFDVMYGDKELAGKLTLPQGDAYGAIGFAYNGGAVNDGDFRFVQHQKNSVDADFSTLVVKVPPDLSEIEKLAVEAVPADMTGLNIGEATICPIATGALVAIVVALVTCAGGCEKMGEKLDQIRLSKAQLDTLGPLASARELLAVRREVFEQHGF
ncbi:MULTISPECIES: hypothetical protein [Mycolicibacterium]|mgnify:CR=1 FL=1|jgi:hypothetical protein|uniref:hypothetical protein n=1 Tax=Mycolicibacterium TaxID=1866885 RepID=UPI0005636144|nr:MULTISPECIES: hypothetical protein [Mycolicibacterium]RUP36903.1 MAG: hypothetical protein EKK60_13885 [Gordonia sp. (in: high G+C Gram-positive bacteria)]MDW5610315.1 hypothetical protein [Mycolicibacterium sp. D5.8-2]PQP39650.1 hypothetical protein C6A88_32550 [Mycolicibacterium austroafricanum]QZY48765.1 hypothetical protein K5L12_14390 [Mycolicibacterium austroafricanum]UJL27283.1 hypothetical protein HZU38_20425 [Mycolicibacterium vanbaalenii]